MYANRGAMDALSAGGRHTQPPSRFSGGAMAVLQESLAHTIDASTLLSAFIGLKQGDFSVRLPQDWTGVAGKVADTFNEMVELNQRMARELDRLSRVVGKEGKLAQRASLGDVSGSWAAAIDSVNELIDDLVHPPAKRPASSVPSPRATCRRRWP